MDISSDTDSAIVLTITESKVLDCYICFEPLSAPISQCENGHSICSSCRAKIGERCPTCCMRISSIRNRALEMVLDSVKVKCPNRKNGCNMTLSYSQKTAHEKICIFSPSPCPVPDCGFKGHSYQFNTHICPHLPKAHRFTYGNTLRLTLELKKENTYFVLQESIDKRMFIGQIFQEALGQGVAVSRFACPESGPVLFQFSYGLTVTNNQNSLKFESEMKTVQKRVGKLSAFDNYLLIPNCSFSSSDGKIKLKLHIHRRPVGTEAEES